MKNIVIIILLIIISQTVSAQEVDPLSFFPSAVGNLWEYSTKNGTARYSIVKDSISDNGDKYIFFTPSGDPSYRIDTQYNVYWQPFNNSLNWHYYKLNADSGDIWIVDTIIAEADTGYMLHKWMTNTHHLCLDKKQ